MVVAHTLLSSHRGKLCAVPPLSGKTGAGQKESRSHTHVYLNTSNICHTELSKGFIYASFHLKNEIKGNYCAFTPQHSSDALDYF